MHIDNRQSMEWDALRTRILDKVARPEDFKVVFDEFVDKIAFHQTTDGRFECDPADYEVALLAVASVDAKRGPSGQSIPALWNTGTNPIDVDRGLVPIPAAHSPSFQEAGCGHDDEPNKPQCGQKQEERPHEQHQEDREHDREREADSVMSHELTPGDDDEEEDYPMAQPLAFHQEDNHNRRSTMSELRMMSRVEGQETQSQEERFTLLGIEQTQNYLEQLPNLNLKRTRSLSLNDIDLSEPDDSSDDSSPSTESVSTNVTESSPLAQSMKFAHSADDRDEKVLSDIWVSEVVPPAVYAEEVMEEHFMNCHHRSKTFDHFQRDHLDDGAFDAAVLLDGNVMKRRSKIREYRSPRSRASHLKAYKLLNGHEWYSHSHSLPRCRGHQHRLKKRKAPSPASQSEQSDPNTVSNLRILLPSEERSLKKEKARKKKKQKERKLKMEEKRHSGSSLMRSVGQLFHGLKRRPKTPNSR